MTTGYHHGISLLGGWLPLTIEIVAAVALVAAIGWRTWRWRLLWMPLAILLAVAGAFTARWYMDSQGLASDPAPVILWVWTGAVVAAVFVFTVGWPTARVWRRCVALLAIPLTVLCVGVALNQWVGYFPSVQSAWGAITAGPLPDQVDASALPGLRNTTMSTGKVVQISVPDTASGFVHRSEFVYLPPEWFAGPTPPTLPAIMMIAGEFNTPADWIRSGNAIDTVDKYAAAHDGQAPILVFVDAGGSFNNDTECVDGPRGNAADHLTEDVRPYIISTFGASAEASDWGIVGWSMGGTCAVDLTVMHPGLFSTFEDVGGDAGPTAGNQQQTIDRLYGGNKNEWAVYDPATVMQVHGPYAGVSGWFTEAERSGNHSKGANNMAFHPTVPNDETGYGGRDGTPDTNSTGAAQNLCVDATAQGITCSIHTADGGHTWQVAANAFSDALPWMAGQVHTLS